MSKKVSTRIQSKHDFEINWLNATFIPFDGEIIIYKKESLDNGTTILEGALKDGKLPEERTTPYTYDRIKIGDGVTSIQDLPFMPANSDWSQTDATEEGYIKNKPTKLSQFENDRDFIDKNGGSLNTDATLSIPDTFYITAETWVEGEDGSWNPEYSETSVGNSTVSINKNEIKFDYSYDDRGMGIYSTETYENKSLTLNKDTISFKEFTPDSFDSNYGTDYSLALNVNTVNIESKTSVPAGIVDYMYSQTKIYPNKVKLATTPSDEAAAMSGGVDAVDITAAGIVFDQTVTAYNEEGMDVGVERITTVISPQTFKNKAEKAQVHQLEQRVNSLASNGLTRKIVDALPNNDQADDKTIYMLGTEPTGTTISDIYGMCPEHGRFNVNVYNEVLFASLFDSQPAGSYIFEITLDGSGYFGVVSLPAGADSSVFDNLVELPFTVDACCSYNTLTITVVKVNTYSSYEEHMYMPVEQRYELIGTTKVDLSDYLTKTGETFDGYNKIVVGKIEADTGDSKSELTDQKLQMTYTGENYTMPGESKATLDAENLTFTHEYPEADVSRRIDISTYDSYNYDSANGPYIKLTNNSGVEHGGKAQLGIAPNNIEFCKYGEYGQELTNDVGPYGMTVFQPAIADGVNNDYGRTNVSSGNITVERIHDSLLEYTSIKLDPQEGIVFSYPVTNNGLEGATTVQQTTVITPEGFENKAEKSVVNALSQKVNTLVSSGLSREVVAELPDISEADSNTIYMVGKDYMGTDIKSITGDCDGSSFTVETDDFFPMLWYNEPRLTGKYRLIKDYSADTFYVEFPKNSGVSVYNSFEDYGLVVNDGSDTHDCLYPRHVVTVDVEVKYAAYDEYIYMPAEQRYELIGNTEVDLSDYATKATVNNLSDKVTALISSSLQKEIVESLPSVINAKANTIYMIASAQKAVLNYVEAICNDSRVQADVDMDWFMTTVKPSMSGTYTIRNIPVIEDASGGFYSVGPDGARLDIPNMQGITLSISELVDDGNGDVIVKQTPYEGNPSEERLGATFSVTLKTTSYDEYLFLPSDQRFELIGNTEIDLSDYVKKEELKDYATKWEVQSKASKSDIITETSKVKAIYDGSEALGSMANKTISYLQDKLNTWLDKVATTANASANFYAETAWPDKWNDGNNATINAGVKWTVTVVATYNNSSYTQLRFATYTDKHVFYACRKNNVWSNLRHVAFADDLDSLVNTDELDERLREINEYVSTVSSHVDDLESRSDTYLPKQNVGGMYLIDTPINVKTDKKDSYFINKSGDSSLNIRSDVANGTASLNLGQNSKSKYGLRVRPNTDDPTEPPRFDIYDFVGSKSVAIIKSVEEIKQDAFENGNGDTNSGMYIGSAVWPDDKEVTSASELDYQLSKVIHERNIYDYVPQIQLITWEDEN